MPCPLPAAVRGGMLVWLLTCFLAGRVNCDEHPERLRDEGWLSGPTFHRQLATKLDLAWSAAPLRQRILALARTQRVCIWLDRRIDSSYELEFSSTDASLAVALARLAAKLGAAVGYTDSVVYLGPPSAASKFATLVALRTDEANRLPAPARAAWLEQRAWQWPMLTTPKELIQQLAQEVHVTCEGIEQIDHDLWPAGDLPSVSRVERLSLVLAGFDLTFQLEAEGRAARLVPMPAEARLVRTYTPRGDAARISRELARDFPQARVQQKGSRLLVAGAFEDHRLIERLLRGEKIEHVAGAASEMRFTLNVKNQPLGAVLERIAQLGLTVDIDPQLQTKLRDLVSIRVENGTIESVIQAALEGRGIHYRLEGKTLHLRPAP